MAVCNNCGFTLIYDPEKKKLFCKSCGSTFAPEEIDDENREYLEDRNPIPADEVYGDDPESYMDCNIYTCEHCGADIVVTDTEASTYCIYCGSPSVVFSRIARQKRPELIAPFSVTKERALELVRKHIRKGIFIPLSLKKVKIEDIRGIYIPFWMAHVTHRDAVFISGQVKEGKNYVTKYYERAGNCEFNGLLFDASRKLNDESTLRLEPYNINSLVKFDEEYLSGFYSDIPDVSKEDITDLISSRATSLFIEKAVNSVNAMNVEALAWSGTTKLQGDPRFVLLPAWFVTFEYKDKSHMVLVNGSSGKVVCALPWSEPIFFALVILVGLLISAAAAALLYILLFAGVHARGSGSSLGTVLVLILGAGISGFIAGIRKYRNVIAKMKLTQSSEMMDYVKRRQG
jgi:DNA-directed RNA polymerase subunit RPC12/RpoP